MSRKIPICPSCGSNKLSVQKETWESVEYYDSETHDFMGLETLEEDQIRLRCEGCHNIWRVPDNEDEMTFKED